MGLRAVARDGLRKASEFDIVRKYIGTRVISQPRCETFTESTTVCVYPNVRNDDVDLAKINSKVIYDRVFMTV